MSKRGRAATWRREMSKTVAGTACSAVSALDYRAAVEACYAPSRGFRPCLAAPPAINGGTAPRFARWKESGGKICAAWWNFRVMHRRLSQMLTRLDGWQQL